jgi:hypothetical protein
MVYLLIKDKLRRLLFSLEMVSINLAKFDTLSKCILKFVLGHLKVAFEQNLYIFLVKPFCDLQEFFASKGFNFGQKNCSKVKQLFATF